MCVREKWHRIWQFLRTAVPVRSAAFERLLIATMEYRRLNKRQKEAHWQSFHESQAQKAAQLQQLAALRGAPSSTGR